MAHKNIEKQQPEMKMLELKYDEPETGAVVPSTMSMSLRVTIANLPPDMLQCDIYLLCNKAEAQPLQVDMRSFTSSTQSTTYYAIVHVKHSADVQNIVQGLDNLIVNGYQLIVAPYETLVEEGKTSQRNK